MKIATWNIGGGILGESHQIDGVPDLSYYADFLRVASPDVLCLQEQHSYGDAKLSQAEELAGMLGYPYWQSQAYSPSHTESGAYLSLGMLSRFPLIDTRYTEFENPRLKATGPNGTPWAMFDKGFTETLVRTDTEDVRLINIHGFPFHYFGANATEERFEPIWDTLVGAMSLSRERGSTIVAGDFNVRKIESVMGDLLAEDFENAFVGDTTPDSGQQDYVLYDSRLHLMRTSIVPTRSDHSYCEVVLELT